jgi:hypothetical protein
MHAHKRALQQKEVGGYKGRTKEAKNYIPNLGKASPYVPAQCSTSPTTIAFRNCLFGS